MEIQQMWASPHLGKKGHYARFLLGSMGGILLVGLFLSVGGAILLMPQGTKKALPSLFLCFINCCSAEPDGRVWGALPHWRRLRCFLRCADS